ncbi:MAG: serine/threonine-protein kinase [Thermoleophilaceae bacterium]
MERPETTEELRTERLAGVSASADTRALGRSAGPAAARSEELVLGRYRLGRRLGAGGFGVVWAALDERLEREVAVKAIPHGEDSRGPEREARAVARLNHPGIVALYELGSDDENVYLVSELVHGSTFGELGRAGALSDRDVARIGLALCDALAHAHDKGVIHRDVKPQNVLVAAEPAAGAGFAKLADFGVAHLAGGDPLTRTGDVVGTLAYMAPEQAEGQRVTPAADVYSLALTLFEGWTGTNPVRAASPAATARRLGRPLPPLGRLRRDLPAGLCDAVDAALHPWPDRRPALEELRAALASSAGTLSDEGGLVEPGTIERFGLATSRRLAASAPAGPVARVLAGLAAGGLGVLALATLGPDPLPFSPLAAGAVAAVLVALLPRLGWLAAAAALAAWLASEGAVPGTALVLAAGLAAVPPLLPRAGRLWSAPAAAPLLGAAALGPMYVALAGLAGGPWRRAGLGAAGFVWLALAEVVSGDALLFGPPGDALARAAWEGSLGDAAGDALLPLVTTPALAPVLVWAAFAAALPLAVRGRSLALDTLRGAVWAAGLVAAHSGLGELLAAEVELAGARGAVAGTLLGLAAAVASVAVSPRMDAE